MVEHIEFVAAATGIVIALLTALVIAQIGRR